MDSNKYLFEYPSCLKISVEFSVTRLVNEPNKMFEWTPLTNIFPLLKTT